MKKILFIFFTIVIFGLILPFSAVNGLISPPAQPTPTAICEVIGPKCNARGWELCDPLGVREWIHSCVGQWRVQADCDNRGGVVLGIGGTCECDVGHTKVIDWCAYGCVRNNNTTQCLAAPVSQEAPSGEAPSGEAPSGEAPPAGWVRIENPLEADTFQELIGNIINFIFTIALLIAPAMIIIGAFYFLAAGGNPQQIETGKKIILYTIIGFVIIMLAWGAIELLEGVFR